MSEADDDTVASSLPAAPSTTGAWPSAELVAGRYRIQRWIGGGGMGRVYAAVDTELGNEQIALKVLREGLSDDALERFRREVRLTRRIQHRNVARMFDIGEHAHTKFLTMELVDGVALSKLASPRLPWARLESIAAQLLEGLDAAHAAGVIHRDLKPDNVLVERGTDRVVITDFGIARSLDDASVTQAGVLVGTPRYMSPEQLAGTTVDGRSDLFSLGVMLYELASGQRPWGGENALAIAVAQATQPVRPASPGEGRPAFFALVHRLLELDPAARPQSAREVADELARIGSEGGAEAPDGGGGTTSTRAVRPSPASTAAATTPFAATASPSPPTGASRASSPSLAAVRSSVAVLPVTCAAGDEHVADALLEELTDGLAAAGLRVRQAMRSSVVSDPRARGQELGVDHVVGAAVRRLATGLRISMRLISVADGFQIWAHRVECAEGELLAVSDELARGILQALSSRAPVATPRRTDPRAVELYLRARGELRRFWGDHVEAAADLLDAAAELAPESEPILAARAFAAVQAWVMTTSPARAPRAREALERGLETGHGEAFLASAIYRFNRGDAEGGATDLATALTRAPMSSPAHEVAGRLLVEVDSLAAGRAELEIALGLDPGRAKVIAVDLARIEALEGDLGAARRRIAPLLADPDESVVQLGSMIAARLCGWTGDLEGLRARAERFAPRIGTTMVMIQRFMAGVTHETDPLDHHAWTEFLRTFEQADQPLRHQLMGLQVLTEVALAVGATGAGLDALGHAAQLGLLDHVWLRSCPLTAQLADVPRFRAIRPRVEERAARVRAAYQASIAAV